jgi:hypothetical protein
MNDQIPTLERGPVKLCSDCNILLPLGYFGKHSREKDGLRKICKECRTIYSKSYYEKNKSEKINYQKDYAIKNAEKIKAQRAEYYLKNKQKALARTANWAAKNQHKRAEYSKNYYNKNKAYYHAHSAKRRELCKIQTIPMDKTQWFAIVEIYKSARRISQETGVPHHVDHIMPLNGKNCLGLHVPWNLQIIPAMDNLRKSNKVIL